MGHGKMSHGQPGEVHVHKEKESFTPLVLVVLGIAVADYLTVRYLGSADWRDAMRLFMGYFFLAFGFFKTLDWKGFISAYAEYDIIAARSKAYAAAYPAIELALAVLFLADLYPVATNAFTAVLMGVSSIGVIRAVTGGQKIRCACLGTVVKLPMTTITIIEDVGMGLMATIMLIASLA